MQDSTTGGKKWPPAELLLLLLDQSLASMEGKLPMHHAALMLAPFSNQPGSSTRKLVRRSQTGCELCRLTPSNIDSSSTK